MTSMKNYAYAALLTATALGFSMTGANAAGAGATGQASSGAGVSAQSSVGRADNSNDASGQPVAAPAMAGTSENSGGTANDNGSGTADNYSNSSTSRSQVLGTSDSSSSDSISDNGAKDNDNSTTANASTDTGVAGSVIAFNNLQNGQISSIQSSLRAQGFHVANDGIWGPRSTAALRNFQAKNNLPVTGELDTATVSALNISDLSSATPSAGDARVMNDDSSSVNGTDASGRLNGNSDTSGSDNGSGTGY